MAPNNYNPNNSLRSSTGYDDCRISSSMPAAAAAAANSNALRSLAIMSSSSSTSSSTPVLSAPRLSYRQTFHQEDINAQSLISVIDDVLSLVSVDDFDFAVEDDWADADIDHDDDDDDDNLSRTTAGSSTSSSTTTPRTPPPQ